MNSGQVAFDLMREPRGEDYRRLLGSLAGFCSEVLFVLRDDLGLDQSGEELLRRIEPFLVQKTRGSNWPGTVLSTDEATLYRYTYSPAVMATLMAASAGLYDWQQPARPEDLCLLRSDGSVLLATIAHEKDGFLELAASEVSEIERAFPAFYEYAAVQDEHAPETP